jgi:hypothetical protein
MCCVFLSCVLFFEAMFRGWYVSYVCSGVCISDERTQIREPG